MYFILKITLSILCKLESIITIVTVIIFVEQRSVLKESNRSRVKPRLQAVHRRPKNSGGIDRESLINYRRVRGAALIAFSRSDFKSRRD